MDFSRSIFSWVCVVSVSSGVSEHPAKQQDTASMYNHLIFMSPPFRHGSAATAGTRACFLPYPRGCCRIRSDSPYWYTDTLPDLKAEDKVQPHSPNRPKSGIFPLNF